MCAAVTLGLVSAGRFRAADAIGYVIVQALGAVAAAGKPGFDVVTSGLASNGYGAHSPGGYSFGACLVTEFVMTLFLFRLFDWQTRPDVFFNNI